MACINRTTNRINNETLKVYPKACAINYKKDDGSYEPIDFTFEDSSSKIGDIQLNRKNVFSTGIRKDKNPNKFVGIRPDNCQDGSKQIEFSINKVKIDGVSNYNINDFSVQVDSLSFFQLYKNSGFKDFEIEFKIDLKGVSVENEKYTESTKIRNSLKTEFIDLGQDTGSNILNRYANDSDITESNSYLRIYYGQITDEFIAKFGYSNEEEFGDADVSNYSIYDMGVAGSSTYLKDAIVFYIHSKDIDDIENSILINLCNKYGLSLEGNEEDTGKYFFKNGKKIGGYFNDDNKFLGYFNTKEISSKIKSLFIRKDFNDTSYINLTQSQFNTDMKAQFNYDVDSIEVGTDYYKGAIFQIKIANNSYWIDEPKIMNSNKEFISRYGDLTHTLKDNGDGSYTYTKYLTISGLLRNLGNIENYIDVNVYSTDFNTKPAYTRAGTTMNDPPTTSDLDYLREATTGTSADYGWQNMVCGYLKSSNNPQSGQHYFTLQHRQSHLLFDVSSVSSATAVKYKLHRWYAPTMNGATNNYAGMKMLYCKSTATNISNIDTNAMKAGWNDFVGHSVVSSAWGESSLTKYIDSEVAVTNTSTPSAGDALTEDTLNSNAVSDINSDSTFKMCIMEYDEYVDGSINTGETIPDVKNKKNQKFINGINWRSDVTNSSYDATEVGHLEITTSTTTTVTHNATFFGANF